MNTNICRNFFTIIAGLFFAAVCLASSPAKVWRADSRGPDIIFQQGFTSYGTNIDIIQHIVGESCSVENSAFISTTTNESMARDWAVRHLLDHWPARTQYYIYEIRPTNSFYSAVMSLEHIAQTPHLQSSFGLYFALRVANSQSEYDAMYRIESQQIIGVTTLGLDQNGRPVVTGYQANPSYIPGDTYANAGPFTGSDQFPPENISVPRLTGVPPETACFLSPDELAARPRFEPFLLYMLNNILD